MWILKIICKQISELLSLGIIDLYAQWAIHIGDCLLILDALRHHVVPGISLHPHFDAERKHTAIGHAPSWATGWWPAWRAVSGSNALVQSVLVFVQFRGDEALELITFFLLERSQLLGIKKPILESTDFLLVFCVLLHVFQHKFFDGFLEFLNSALNYLVLLMNVHKIDVLGWDRVQIGKLAHEFQVAVALVRLVLLHLSLFEHHVSLCLEIVLIKSEVIDEMNSQKHIFFQRISKFRHKLLKWKLLKILIFV